MISKPRYLAIDFGLARIGLAINFATLAEPLVVVETERALQYVKALVVEHSITTIVLGISEGEIPPLARKFAQQVCEECASIRALQVIEVDETGSSAEVHAHQHAQQLSKSKRQAPIDHFSAANILQWYIDTLPAEEKSLLI